jgi:hypothetical protein
VNPNRYDDTSKLNYLCAAGVCFMYLVALNTKLREMGWFKRKKINEPDILNFLDLVSLGTVCDVVPLIGLNRAIVKQGLKVLKKRSNLGLKTVGCDSTLHKSYKVFNPRLDLFFNTFSPCLTMALFKPINGTTSHTVPNETKSKKFKISGSFIFFLLNQPISRNFVLSATKYIKQTQTR